MITGNSNSSLSNDSNFERYIGVAALHVVAINPDMKTLNSYGYNLTEEPEYIRTIPTDDNNAVSYHNMRLLCSIDDLPDKPLISLFFRAYPEVEMNKDGSKAKIIDNFVNTAWATREEVKEKKVPEIKKDKMDENYRLCHRGEEEILTFLKTYLNIMPYERYDRNSGTYVRTKNPGQCYFDDWKKIVSGDITEVKEAINLQPENLLRVVLGIRTDDNNKMYQTFIPTEFISYGASPRQGEDGKLVYPRAEKIIANWQRNGYHSNEQFSAEPVKVYSEKPTEVKKEDTGDPWADSDDLPFD